MDVLQLPTSRTQRHRFRD